MKRKSISLADRNFILWLYDYKCANCRIEDNLEIDHIIPFSLGGEHHVQNMQCLCSKCNLRKSNTHDGVFVYDKLKTDANAGGAMLEYIFGNKEKASQMIAIHKATEFSGVLK